MSEFIGRLTPQARKLKGTLKAGFAAGLLLVCAGLGYLVYRNGVDGTRFKAWNQGLPGSLMMLAGGLVMLACLAVYFFSGKLKRESGRLLADLSKDRYKYLLIAPGILSVFLFNYLPMYGIVLAFKDFKARLGILASPWNGWTNFTRFFGKSISTEVILNTLHIGVVQLLVSFPVPIILALLMNELRSKRFRRTVQSVLYLPHFVSWIVIYSLLYSLFSVTSGIVNKIILSMGGNAFNLLSDPNKFRPLLYGSNVWKEAGWGTIIYMAAIAGIDQEMYEAAYLDGANRWQQVLYITLPSIMFSVMTLLILNVGSILGNNFDQIMNLRTAPTMAVSNVIDTYVYDMGVTQGQFGLSTAIGLFQQVVNCILLFTTNSIVKRMTGEGFF
ncbi:MAG: ABC transporter permease subunit [Bacillota bacterium]|nr:ABC transporter permease subunit [Bacillota bacterium]